MSDAETTADRPAGRSRIVFVTGVSGAGKSSALKALEDIGYEAVDNLPISLIAGLLGVESIEGRGLAVGIDVRTRDFNVGAFLDQLETLRALDRFEIHLVYLDCDDDILQRRFAASRRRHPLAQDRPVADGIARERVISAGLQRRADVVIDSSSLTLGALRALLADRFAQPLCDVLSLFVVSFSYGHGLPREADLVFDVRFLRNPYYDPVLKDLTGCDVEVGAHIEEDPGFERFFDTLRTMLGDLLPRFEVEGKTYLTVALGCTGGRHRSVYVAERLSAWLSGMGRKVHLRHRDLGRSTAD
ncbi:MAG: RNase adapter RapZ [Proteobacteria bacterium]|nr:RNase adapter RapZ [Pseudomonadota bacterium]